MGSGKKTFTDRSEKTLNDRALNVYKKDSMIQRARFTLTVREQRCVLYAISQIKPTDTAFQEYELNLKDLYALCGLSDKSYTEMKALLTKLKSKCWWLLMPDGETESCVSWFNKVRVNRRSGKVIIRFDDDMVPYLLQIVQQQEYFTGYSLQYTLPMKSQYSPRLYEVLKSYQKNNTRWFFEIEELKRLLDCQNYKNFNDFKRRALDPAVDEINKYTDLSIAYKIKKDGVRVDKIFFGMVEKTNSEILETQKMIREELDGQMSIFDIREESRTDPIEQLMAENAKKRRAEREAKDENG